MIQYMKELGMELKEIKEIPVPEIVQGSLAVVIWYAGKNISDSFSLSGQHLAIVLRNTPEIFPESPHVSSSYNFHPPDNKNPQSLSDPLFSPRLLPEVLSEVRSL